MFDRFSQFFTKSYGVYLDIIVYTANGSSSKYEKKRASLKFFTDYFILLIENEKLQIFYAEIINFKFEECIIEFTLIIDREGKSVLDFRAPIDCTVENYYVKFIDNISMADVIQYFKKPLVDYKCDYLIYNRKYDRFDEKRPMGIQLYKVDDFRINLESVSHFNKFFKNIPFIENILYIKTDSLDRCTASTQYFIHKDERSFTFIREDGFTKKLIFREALDFLNFNSLYINSFGEGYFSLRSEEEMASMSSSISEESEECEYMKSYVTDLKISDDPNRYIALSDKNIFVTDGQSLAIMNKDIDNLNKTYVKNVAENATKIHLKDEDSVYFLDGSLKKLDLHKEKVTSTVGKDLKDIYNFDEHLNAITENSIVQVDERANELVNLNKYKTKVEFNVASNSKKLTAIGSANGDVRIYKDVGKRALVHIYGYGTECIGISIYNKFLAATYKNYIILIYGKLGEELENLRKSKVETKKLTLSLKHTLLLKNTSLCPAIFTEDGYLFSAAGNYVISWDINKIKNRKESTIQSDYAESREGYKFEKYENQVVADRIKEGKLYVLMEDKVQMDFVDGFGFSE